MSENMLETQIPGTYRRPTESETLGLGPKTWVFTSLPGNFWACSGLSITPREPRKQVCICPLKWEEGREVRSQLQKKRLFTYDGSGFIACLATWQQVTQGLGLGPQVGLCWVWPGSQMPTYPDRARGLAPRGRVPEGLRWPDTPRPTAVGNSVVSVTTVPEAAR